MAIGQLSKGGVKTASRSESGDFSTLRYRFTRRRKRLFSAHPSNRLAWRVYGAFNDSLNCGFIIKSVQREVLRQGRDGMMMGGRRKAGDVHTFGTGSPVVMRGGCRIRRLHRTRYPSLRGSTEIRAAAGEATPTLDGRVPDMKMPSSLTHHRVFEPRS